MNKLSKYRLPRRQRGAVLIVALVLLLVLTVLGTAGIQDTVMEERMAGNFRNLSEALQAGDSTLSLEEQALLTSLSMDFDNADTSYDGYYAISSVSIDPKLASEAVRYVDIASASVVSPHVGLPQYFVERLPRTVRIKGESLKAGKTKLYSQYFRVTSRGSGVTSSSEVMLQTTFKPQP